MTQPAGLSEGDINSNEESLFVKEPLLPSTKTIANSPLLAGKSKQSYKQPWPQPNSSECRRVLRTAIVLQLTTFKNSRIDISCVELYEHRVALELYFGLPTLPRGQLPYYTVYRSGLTTTCVDAILDLFARKSPRNLRDLAQDLAGKRALSARRLFFVDGGSIN